jgi:ribosome biogenesis GTPase
LDSEGFARLAELGWDEYFARRLAGTGDGTAKPARVGADHGSELLVHHAAGVERARVSGALIEAGRRVAVGDWVALRPMAAGPEVFSVLERRSAIVRKVPGVETQQQLLAANVDLMLITTSLDGDFNLRRVERLIAVAHQSRVTPAVILTKTDLGPAAAALAQVEALAPGMPLFALSPLTGEGVGALRSRLSRGLTAALVGSSGVGKSTLVNRLAGSDRLVTAEVHRSGQGRHTTTHRELIPLPGGGVIIDTPGLREIQVWAADGLDEAFPDIEELGLSCRFSDCRHDLEPGCAVKAGLADGTLDPGRWAGYSKLKRELASVEVRSDQRLLVAERRRWKARIRHAADNAAAKRGFL